MRFPVGGVESVDDRMMTAVSTTHSTIHASTSGMPSTSGSTRFTNGTPSRMPMKGKAASNRKDMSDSWNGVDASETACYPFDCMPAGSAR